MLSKNPKKLLILLGSIAFLVQGDNYAAAPLLVSIAKDLNLSIPSAALSVSSYMIPFGIFTLIFGPLADRFGKAKILNLAAFCTAIFSMLCAIAFDLTSLCILRGINGAFAAAVLPVAVSLVGDSFEDSKRQNALGAVIGMMFFGGAVSPGIGGLVSYYGSWRLLYLIYGIAELIVAIIMIKSLERNPGVITSLNFIEVYKKSFNNKNLIKVVSILFFLGFSVFGSFMFSGKFIQDKLGYNILFVGAILSLFGLATAIGGRRAGTLKQMLGNNLLIYAGVLGGVSWCSMILWNNPFLISLSLIGFGFAFILLQSTIIQTAQQLMPKQRGTVMSLASFNMFIGGGIGTFVNGKILSLFGFVPIFMISSIIIFVVGLIISSYLNKAK
ncbi:MAG TPA: MFS transporter [Methanofastidiosum sp.]|nr:MFS transporter [Methanofastidiosum sp.]HNU61774.1 MFS transporter [Methanofastidiosum sp.]HOI77820.1 MFS transporter [Methanofastidiosum sp.]